MTRRRTSAPQRRARASEAALGRRVSTGGASQLGGTTLAIIGIGALIVVGLTAILVFALLSSGPSESIGEPQAMDGRTHVPACVPGNYSSVPPASGCHSDPPAEWGVYPSAQDPVQLIHNLEHGGIVIWYQAGQVTADQIAALETYTRSWNGTERYKVIVSPWGGSDFGHPIAVVAWTWLLYLEDVDTDLMDQFIDQHYGDAPEPAGGPGPPPQ